MNSCTIPFVILRLLAARPRCGHARPQAIPPGRAQCSSCIVGPPGDTQRALRFGRRHPPATPVDAPAAIPAAPPAPTAQDPVVVANAVVGTGATAYPADIPPITSLSMLRSQPPFAWKLDLPGQKPASEEFVEVEVETQDGPLEPRLKISFPYAITFPNPGGGSKEGNTIIALYAYRLPGGHWRMDCCVQGRVGVPAGQLRRLAALPPTGVTGWGDRAEEHMSYGWLQMHTRAKEEKPRHLGEVGGAVNVDAEEGGRKRGTMPPPCGAPRAASPRTRAGPARPPNFLPSRVANPRLQSPCWQSRPPRMWTLGWRRKRGPCPSGRSGRWRRRGRFSSCEASSWRQSSGRTRRAAGNGGGAGAGPPPGAGPQTQAEGGRTRAAAGRADGRGGGKGRGGGGLVRSTLWRGASPGKLKQRR